MKKTTPVTSRKAADERALESAEQLKSLITAIWLLAGSNAHDATNLAELEGLFGCAQRLATEIHAHICG